jgi:hypothetical protein
MKLDRQKHREVATLDSVALCHPVAPCTPLEDGVAALRDGVLDTSESLPSLAANLHQVQTVVLPARIYADQC